MYVEPGMIVTAPYHDIFTDEEALGIFLVLHVDKNNVICLKITSKTHDDYDYYVNLPEGCCKLVTNSNVCVNKIYTLHIANLKHIMDRLPNQYMVEVLSTWNKVTQNIFCDILKVIGGV